MANNNRLDLKQLIRQNKDDYVDNTDGIRRLKHSDLILYDIDRMETLKKEHNALRDSNPNNFLDMCKRKCSFLYSSYTDIFNRCYKGTLDNNLMREALNTLKKIEIGEMNQQEGSVEIGKLFYKVFVSSAVKEEEEYKKKEEELQKQGKIEKKENSNDGKDISWQEFKNQYISVKPDEKTRDGRTPKKKQTGKKPNKKKK